MIVGLDVRDSSVIAIRIDQHGTLIGRAEHGSATGAGVVDVVRAICDEQPKRLGAALRDPGDVSAIDIVAAAAGAVRVTVAPRVVTPGAAVALAEQWRGAARGARHVVALTAGECVHAGLVIDGRTFDGAHGLAGAAAWLALNPVERDDYRKMGCLEAEIGSGGIVRRLVWRIKGGDQSVVLQMADGKLAAITVAQIFDAARAGDDVALAVVRDTARYIGMAIANLVAILDPDVVVLGGLIADAGELLVEPARSEALRRMSASAAGLVHVVPGTLGEDAAALGAARAAML